MTFDLGNLTAGISIDTSDAVVKLGELKREVDSTSKAIDGLDGKPVDVAPKGAKELDAAGAAATALGDNLDAAGAAAGKIKVPTAAKKELVETASASTDLAEGLDKAGAAAGKVKVPTGLSGALSKAAGSAASLADELRAAKEEADKMPSRGPSALDGALGGLASTAKGLLPQITAIAAGGMVINKGWDRLTSIDNATFKLQGLGHSGDSVTEIMNSALTSVKGTAFGLGDAASAAASAVASGVQPGQQLTQVLTTMADTAAISGASLQDVGMIFNSVMAKGKLQGDDLLQLVGRGVPVLQMIGKQLGITAAEVSKLATDGEISFEIFESAMRAGMGGAAQEMGNSIQGAMSNAQAAIGRLGASVLQVVASEGPAAFASFTEGVDMLTTGVNAAYGAWEKVPGPIKLVIGALVAAKVAQMAMNTEMARGVGIKVAEKFASAASSVADFTSNITANYRATRAANPMLGSFSAGLMSVVGSGGLASQAMNGMKGAAGGLLTALGGPWGLAIGGATVALGLFMEHVQDTKQKQQEAEAATQSWADVLSQANGIINDSVRQHAIAQVQALDMADTMNSLGISTADASKAVLDIDGSYGSLMTTLDRIIEQGTTLEGDARIGQKLVRTEDAENAIKLKEELEALSGQQSEGAERAREAAAANNELALELAQNTRASQSAAKGMNPLLSVLEATEAEAKSVDDAIKNLSNAMMGLSDDPALRLQSYIAEAASDLRGLKEVLKNEGGDGGFDIDTGMFDVMTEKGAELHSTMLDLKQSMYDTAAATYESAVMSGKDGAEAWGLAAAESQKLTDQLVEQYRAAGWSEERIDKLIDTYSLVPGDIATQIQALGVEEANNLINNLDERLLNIDKNTHTITVDSSAVQFSKEQAEEMGYTWEDIGNNTIQLTADTAQARLAIDEMANRTEHLKTQDNTIVFRGETRDLADQINKVEGMAAELRTNPAELHVVADTDKARAGIEKLGLEAKELPDGELWINTNSDEKMQELLNLGAETVALPDGFIEITDTSDANLQALKELGVQTTTLPDGKVVITDNAKEVRNNIETNLASWVLNRSGKVVFDVIRNIRTVFGGGGGSTPENANGGLIPKLASGGSTHGGYRLPLTGPGTNKTDGILGVDSWGVPTSWVDRGEFVTKREATAKWLRTLIAINNDDPQQIAQAFLSELPAFADGGILPASEIKRRMADMNNGQYLMGGFSPRATDCSSGVSAVVNEMLGLPRFESRMSTVTQGQWLAAKGAKPGRGDEDDVVIGWYDYGGGVNGHTSMRLQDGTFIESGGNTGQGFTIGGKAGSLDGRGYTNFMHFPYDSRNDKNGGDGSFLTGDEGAKTSMGTPRAEFDALDVKDGASGVGSTFGTSFNRPGLASNVSDTPIAAGFAGQGGFAGEVSALRNPLMGSNTWRGTLGDAGAAQILSVAQQLEDAIGQGGIKAQVEQALDGNTPNWDVWLRVSPETIEAFNTLGEAKAARENATYDVADAEEALAQARQELTDATSEGVVQSESMTRRLEDAEEDLAKARADGKPDKIADAEKKLARLREDAAKELAEAGTKAGEEQSKAAENLAKAEAKLIEEREKEQRAIADLQRANNEYSIAMAVAPVNALMELASGVVDGTKAMAEAFARLDEVIQSTNEVLVRHEEAQIKSKNATYGAVKAEQNLVRQQRTTRTTQHTDILAMQQAEWDLAMARHKANQTVGASEVDLSKARQQGIWDVFQASSSADQAAMLSAQQVAMMEAHLAMVKAEKAVREQEAAAGQQMAMIELEFAQREAEVQAQYLAIATSELAAVQGEAAGIAGYGASAMAKKSEGTATKQGGLFGILGALAKGAIGLALAPATGGQSLMMTLGAVAEGIGGIGNFFRGNAQEKAYAAEAKKEFDALPKDIQQMIIAQQAGIPLGAAAGALMGAAGGSRDDVATVQKAVSGAFSVGLDIAISKAQAALKAAEAKRVREERELAVKERQNRLDELNARLEADREAFGKENSLAELLEIARQQYQEMVQENKQLSELNQNLAPKNRAVLMQLGGSSWGEGTGGPSLSDMSKGFAGLTAEMLSKFSSVGMENQWADAATKDRVISPWTDPDALNGGGLVSGLPETVVDGLYRAQVEGAVQAALSNTAGAPALTTEQIGQIVERTIKALEPGTNVGTQFTGDVTIQGQQAQDTVERLAEQLARAH